MDRSPLLGRDTSNRNGSHPAKSVRDPPSPLRRVVLVRASR